MAPTDCWICPRCRAANAAGADVCRDCASAALCGARALRPGDATTAPPPPPGGPRGDGWMAREVAFLLPEMLLAGALLLACPVWFVSLLGHGQVAAAVVLVIGVAPAFLLAVAACRQKSAGGLYLTSWVTFVAMAIAFVVARLT